MKPKKTYELIFIPFKNTEHLKVEFFKQDSAFTLNLVSWSKTIEMKKLVDGHPKIKNKKIALKKLFDFIRYVNSHVDDFRTINLPANKSQYNPIHNFEHLLGIHKYQIYLDILNQSNIFIPILNENGRLYSTEEGKSKRFKLSKIEENDLCICAVQVKKTDNLRINNQIKGLPKKFVETIRTLSIDILLAYEAELIEYENNVRANKTKALNSFIWRINRLFQFANEPRFIKYGDKVNRIYHNASNISSVCIEFSNFNFNHIDIPNCQPLLLIYLLKKEGLAYDECYLNDCINANFYEKFFNQTFQHTSKSVMKGFNEKPIKYKKEDGSYSFIWNVKNITVETNNDRGLVKNYLYKSIFFRWDETSGFNQYFKKLYPITWNSYNQYLKNNKSTSASTLQNLEASIINPIVPLNSTHYYTHFDGIFYTSANDTMQIINEIKKSFNDVGISLKKLEINGIKQDI